MIDIKKEPITREHTMGAICSQDKDSLPTITLLSKYGNLVYSHQGGTYNIAKTSFALIANNLTYNGTTIELPQRKCCTPIERIYIGLGLSFKERCHDYDIDPSEVDFKSLFHVLTTMALKDLKLLHSSFSQFKQLKYGVHVFEAYLKSVTGSGNIPAKYKCIRWLNEADTLQLKSKLFEASHYQVRVNSMKYTPTAHMEAVMEKVFEYFQIIRFREVDIELRPLDFKSTTKQFSQMKIRDTILLLNACIGYHQGFIIRPRITDTQDSRVYSEFTSISSETRSLLGFINYDIGSALQTITLQLLEERSVYPLHQELVDDKKAFRGKVMRETGNDMAWVKKELSKIDNLDKMPAKYKLYPTLQTYFKEAQVLRINVIESVPLDVLVLSTVYAKPKWVPIYTKGKKEPDFIIDGVKESSIFFFIWTQYEREIREAMMSCFSVPEACHQVHDAVYSKEGVAVNILEEAVLEQTKFKVKISKD